METSKVISLSRGKAKEELRNFFNRSIAEAWATGIKESGVSIDSIIQGMMNSGEAHVHDDMMIRLEDDFDAELDKCLSEYRREQ
jgi:hypothetical protein